MSSQPNPRPLQAGLTLQFPQSLAVIKTYNRINAAFPGQRNAAEVVVKARDVDTPAVKSAIAQLQAKGRASGNVVDALDTRVSRDHTVADITVPIRHHHPIEQPGAEAMLLLMPAWSSGKGSFLGTKIVTVFPDNGKLSKAAVLGSYILMSGETGEPLAVIDGTSLTRWRTACDGVCSPLDDRRMPYSATSESARLGSNSKT